MSDTFRPRRMRLTEPSFAHYTGPIGSFEFVDGVSKDIIIWYEANRIGSCIQAEDADVPGWVINPAAEHDRTINRSADSPIVIAVSEGKHINAEGSPLIRRYSREELEELADKDGLIGVREVARVWGRTGRSIAECIDGVMDAQG